MLLTEAYLVVCVFFLYLPEALLLLLLPFFALFGPDELLGAQVFNRLLIQRVIVHELVSDVVGVHLELVCGSVQDIANDCLLTHAVLVQIIKYIHLPFYLLFKLGKMFRNHIIVAVNSTE